MKKYKLDLRASSCGFWQIVDKQKTAKLESLTGEYLSHEVHINEDSMGDGLKYSVTFELQGEDGKIQVRANFNNALKSLVSSLLGKNLKGNTVTFSTYVKELDSGKRYGQINAWMDDEMLTWYEPYDVWSTWEGDKLASVMQDIDGAKGVKDWTKSGSLIGKPKKEKQVPEFETTNNMPQGDPESPEFDDVDDLPF